MPTRSSLQNSIPGPSVRGSRTARKDAATGAVALVAECVAGLLRSGHQGEAAEVHAVLARWAPDSPRVALLAGLLAFASGRYEEAETSYRGLLRKHPDADAGRAFLAECLIARRRWREAESQIERVRSNGRDPAAVELADQLAAGLESGLFQQTVTSG